MISSSSLLNREGKVGSVRSRMRRAQRGSAPLLHSAAMTQSDDENDVIKSTIPIAQNHLMVEPHFDIDNYGVPLPRSLVVMEMEMVMVQRHVHIAPRESGGVWNERCFA